MSFSHHSEMLMTSDVLRTNHFTIFDNEEYLKKKKKVITAVFADHSGDLICTAALFYSEGFGDPSEFGLI